MSKHFLILISTFLIISCSKEPININNEDNLYKKIDTLFKASLNNTFSDSSRNEYLSEATENIKKLKNDSLKAKSYIKTAFSNLMLGNLDSFGEISKKTLRLTTLNNDIINQARAYSDLGYYYQLKYKPDSAFYSYHRALKIYMSQGNDLLEGKMLLSMATIQVIEKDYLGSEINAIKALSIFQMSSEFESIYLCYYNLSIIELQLKNYDKAIEYKLKGIKYFSKLKNPQNYKILDLNGIGVIYQKKGDNNRAITHFEKVLDIPNISKQFPLEYAMVIDNLAYSKFKLGQLADLPKLFYKSLKIRDSLHVIDGVTTSNLHLSEFFLSKKDSVKSLRHALKAKELAKSSNNYRDLLKSYLLLSKLEPNMNGNEYLQEHIRLTDSLQQNERSIREKFTRIAYETDEITKEKEEVTKMNWLLTITLIIGIALFTVVYFFIRQRSKNKELLFNIKQDEANVEIYNLMLSQQSKFQEGSNKEKERIAEELHDGILGRLFGTRLSLDSLNEGTTEREIKEREEYIEEIQIIEEDIRNISRNLKTSLFNTNTSFRKLVEQLIAKQSKIGNFEYELNFNTLTDWENISNSIKINCYRVLQESLQNIHKYAKATEVKIEFYKENENLVLSVKDNGLGFDTKFKNKGIGQKNMLSRAKSLNGKVEFISSLGNGTKVIMKIPL
ncbi:MAG: tetratricopeptide repeat protein [Gelidibacter sp.]|nr:tetratricopeptide repeat protein [Gelidibacter sp.]